ncbi:hypothetical protein Agub_g15135, partial [Astrephomene gubernaculifera]
LLPPPWWSGAMLGRGVGWWLEAVEQGALDALPARRKVGFLNAFEDLLSHLGHAVEPFLPTLLAITLRLLVTATAAVGAAPAGSEAAAGAAEEEKEKEPAADKDEDEDDDEEDDEEGAAAASPAAAAVERHREVRTASLRLLAQVWLRFPAAPSADYNRVWRVFLPAVQPLIPRLQLEAASSKEPPLLECVLSLSL